MSVLESAYSVMKRSEGEDSRNTRSAVWKGVAAQLLDPTNEMSEEQKKAYEAKIQSKLKSGKRLTTEEMNYLRVNNPSLYQVARRVETARQALRERLKNCKSKDEVNQVISTQTKIASAIRREPEREYMVAMVKHEADTFRQSRQYAKLPLTEEKGDRKKKTKETNEDPFAAQDQRDAEGEGSYEGMSLLVQVQFQCNQISQMSQGIL